MSNEQKTYVTLEQLKQIFPFAAKAGRCELFIDGLNKTLEQYNIDSPIKIAAFLSQIGVESGELKYVRELGNSKYFEKYDTGSIAKRLGNSPEADGDGERYRGRGLIQITGKANYKLCGDALGLDLINNPEILEQPEYAWKSAGWYWNLRHINNYADDIVKVTRLVNGGTNHLEERTAYYNKAKKVLGA